MSNDLIYQGLGERLLKEIIATPALKEVILLQLKGIKPEAAPGLVKTMLWGDPGISMSLFGAVPDIVNWLLEFLLEFGRQLNALPEPLLKDILGRIGAGIDRERLRSFPEVYGTLLRRLVVGEGKTPEEAREAAVAALNRMLAALDRATVRLEENRAELAGTISRFRKEVDTAALVRSLRRVASLALASARPSRVTGKCGERGEGARKAAAAVAAVAGSFLVFRLLKKKAAALKGR